VISKLTPRVSHLVHLPPDSIACEPFLKFVAAVVHANSLSFGNPNSAGVCRITRGTWAFQRYHRDTVCGGLLTTELMFSCFLMERLLLFNSGFQMLQMNLSFRKVVVADWTTRRCMRRVLRCLWLASSSGSATPKTRMLVHREIINQNHRA
jgi:hypothetical protein